MPNGRFGPRMTVTSWRQPLDQQILHVAVRVRDDDLGRAGLTGALDGRDRLRRHELAEPLVLEAAGSQLFGRHCAAHALHVDADEHLQRLLRPGLTDAEQEKQGCARSPHVRSPD
jgi:hypothetical protein